MISILIPLLGLNFSTAQKNKNSVNLIQLHFYSDLLILTASRLEFNLVTLGFFIVNSIFIGLLFTLSFFVGRHPLS